LHDGSRAQRRGSKLNWWLPETAVRLCPDSKYAKEHSTEAPKKPTATT
jgi:hypothetical protein